MTTGRRLRWRRPGIIRPGYSEELDAIVHNSRHAKEWVAALEQTERTRLAIQSLKVGYNKVFGYYIEVRNTHSEKVPPEYIRKQTLTNAERYITPELKEYESLILNEDERRLVAGAAAISERVRRAYGARRRDPLPGRGAGPVGCVRVAGGSRAEASILPPPDLMTAPPSPSRLGVIRLWSRQAKNRLCPTTRVSLPAS